MPNRHPARILISEDNAAYCNALKGALSLEFATVDALPAADEAIERVRAQPGFYDVIILDQQFPSGRSGLEALGEIKHLDPEVQVILLTAHGDRQKALAALTGGAYRYIYKGSDDKRDEIIATVTVAYDTAAAHRLNSRLTTENGEWRSYALRATIGCVLAIVCVLVLALLVPERRFAVVAFLFVPLLLVLFLAGQPLHKVGLQISTLAASLRLHATAAEGDRHGPS